MKKKQLLYVFENNDIAQRSGFQLKHNSTGILIV